MKTVKNVVYYLWIFSIVALLVLFISFPDQFTPENLAAYISGHAGQMMLIYALVSLLRGLFLIPSTPFIIAGAILFPESPWTVFTISIAGVLAGSTFVYFFSDLLGFSEKLERKFPKKIAAWHRRLNSPYAIGLVTAWSFFPLVPTDVICYVAGIVRMRYSYLILGVLIGELVLVYLYVFLGKGLLELIMA